MPPVNPITAAIVTAATTIASLVVGLGVITNETAGLAVAVVGSVSALVFQVVNALHHKANAIVAARPAVAVSGTGAQIKPVSA